MANRDQTASCAQLRIVIAALAAGVLVFAVVAQVLGPFHKPGENELFDTYLPGIIPAVAAGALVGRAVLGAVLTKQLSEQRNTALEQAKQGLVPNPLRSLTIIGAALFEGVGMLAGVALLLTGHWSSYLAIAFSLAGILYHLPTQEKVERAVRNSI